MTVPVISAWSAVSAFGIGARAFAAGVARGDGELVDLAQDEWTVPVATGAPVPDFDVQQVLGRKGTRSMDRLSALAVAAVVDLLPPGSRERALVDAGNTGLVLGTTHGSAKSMMDIARDTFTQPKPYFITTGHIPNGIMNSAAAQCAIWHGLRGPNATIAGGRVAVLLALRYTVRLLAARRASAVLCGGVEELTPDRIWLDHRAHAGRPDTPLGEGSAVLLIEPDAPQTPALAEILAVEVRVYSTDTRTDVYIDCLRTALVRAGVAPDDVWAVLASEAPEWQDAERRALDSVVTRRQVRGRPGPDVGAATTALQIAGLLAVEGDAGRVAAVMSVDRDGLLGCAVLRLR